MKKIVLVNHQAHARSVVRLARTITSLTGKSDHGKSSIVRGVKRVQSNRPQGSRYIRKGTKESKIIIDKITHRRTKTINQYLIKGHEDPYKALKRAVPDQVTAELNITEDNIQEQQGNIFLLKDSAGQVAKKLSTLIDSDQAKQALDQIKGEKAVLSAKHKATKDSIERTETEIERLKYYEDAEKALVRLERKQAKIDERIEKRQKLVDTIDRVEYCASILKNLPDVSALEPAKKWLADHKELGQFQRYHKDLALNIQIIERDRWHKDVDLNDLRERAEELKAESTMLDRLAGLIQYAETWRGHYEFYTVRLKDLIDKKLEMIGEECPLCGKTQ